MKQLSFELPIMKYHIFEGVLRVVNSKNKGIPGVPGYITISCGVEPCHYRDPLTRRLQERTLSKQFGMRQPHGLYHTARQNMIYISACLLLNSSAYNTLIYRYFFEIL
jgi:hypothetical protein